eukprot:9251101-Ditylum_brightwellii.AAC.1
MSNNEKGKAHCGEKLPHLKPPISFIDDEEELRETTTSVYELATDLAVLNILIDPTQRGDRDTLRLVRVKMLKHLEQE